MNRCMKLILSYKYFLLHKFVYMYQNCIKVLLCYMIIVFQLYYVVVVFQIRDRSSKEQDLFRISKFIWDPAGPLFFLFKDQTLGFVFSHQGLFAYVEISKEASYFPNRFSYMYKFCFIKNTRIIRLKMITKCISH